MGRGADPCLSQGSLYTLRHIERAGWRRRTVYRVPGRPLGGAVNPALGHGWRGLPELIRDSTHKEKKQKQEEASHFKPPSLLSPYRIL